MTKLDGSAKGGILVALAAKFALPVHFIGVGEGVDDLQAFRCRKFRKSTDGGRMNSQWRGTLCPQFWASGAFYAAYKLFYGFIRQRQPSWLAAVAALGIGLWLERKILPLPLIDRRSGRGVRRTDALSE